MALAHMHRGTRRGTAPNAVSTLEATSLHHRCQCAENRLLVCDATSHSPCLALQAVLEAEVDLLVVPFLTLGGIISVYSFDSIGAM
eukprot:scaffold1771_cov172-Amphora_coffeaeformis.AAC.27